MKRLVAAVGMMVGLSAEAQTGPGLIGLQAVGPVSQSNGFPIWYMDKIGQRVELCLEPSSYCLSPQFPFPTRAISFPDNFPDEAFYWYAEASLNLSNGGRALLVTALEGAFSANVAAGNQIVFGRIRIRLRDATPGARYVVTHPYGQREVFTDADGDADITEDLGIGSFTGPLRSGIGPFLRWDPAQSAPPAGYLGDPLTPHRVVNSPLGTNFFRVVGADLSETFDFIVMGKEATIAGVEAQRVTITGTTMDVFATTLPGQSVVVSSATNAFPPRTLRSVGSNYFIRIAAPNPVTGDIVVSNTTDRPVTSMTMASSDRVLITHATYFLDTGKLQVQAASTDTAAVLSLAAGEGFQETPLDATGLAEVSPAVPPESVTVLSTAGGSGTARVGVEGTDPGNPADVVSAVVTAPALVDSGVRVLLDGRGSIGPVMSMEWTLVDPVGPGAPVVTVAPASDGTASFFAPVVAVNVSLTFEMRAIGPVNEDTTSVSVEVRGGVALAANPGASGTPDPGDIVLLDGSQSPGAVAFRWEQVSGPSVPLVLVPDNAAAAVFTMPDSLVPLVFRLTVSDGATPLATASAMVSFQTVLTVITVSRAEFRSGNAEWRVAGTATKFDKPNFITVTLVQPSGSSQELGVSQVDALGAWEVRLRDSTISPGSADATLSLKASRGGELRNVSITRRN